VVELCAQLHPDVVVIDISMPDLNGIDATRQIVRDDPHVKVIALSMHSDKKYVKEMLSAGACGYLLKDSAFEELGAAIATVLKNKTYLSPQITDTVVKDYVGENAPSSSAASTALSVREREVLQLIAEGKATREIAAALYVSVKTVETHRKQIMDKLGLNSIAELTKYAIREGLTSIE
jgi:DNA-binding NarL/FixJ family response regulator